MFAREAHSLGPSSSPWSDGFTPNPNANAGPGWTPTPQVCEGWGPGCGAWIPQEEHVWSGASWLDHAQSPGLVSDLRAGWVDRPNQWSQSNYPTDIEAWFADMVATPTAPLRISTTAALRAVGHFEDGAQVYWSTTSGTIIGSGQRVLWVPDTVGPAMVQVCVDAPGLSRCLAKDYEISAAQPKVEIESTQVLADWGFGRWIEISGRLEGMDPDDTELSLYKFTDVHYTDLSAFDIATDGTFTVTPFLLNNVTRVSVVAAAPGTDLSTWPGCGEYWCWGEADVVTGHQYPMLADQFSVRGVAVHYLEVADHPDPAIALALDRRSVVPVVGQEGSFLYRSSAEADDYYLYDEAALAIGFVSAGEYELAAQLLDGLAQAQLLDGSWPFSMYANGDPYWYDGDVRYAGAISWTVMAFNAYHLATGTTPYMLTVESALDYLDYQRHYDDGHMPVRFNPSDLPHTEWDERDINSVEHNLDALSAFSGHAQVLGYESHPGVIADLEGWLLDRWNGAYFNPGTHTGYGDNERERYLDTQTWGVLALGGSQTAIHTGLLNDCNVFFDVAGHVKDVRGVMGFSDFAWTTGELPYGPFVWSEGTLGYIAALDEVERATGTQLSCGGHGADALIDSMAQLLAEAKLPTATTNAHPEYGEVPGTAAVAWWLITNGSVNPFRPWETL